MRLCVISLDAVAQPDAGRLFGLPALCALRENGAYCDQVQTVYPTLTYPIHVSLLTGCYPAAHGIGHNQPFQPDTKKEMRAWYWEIGQIKRKTLHQAAYEKGRDVASILWPCTGMNPYARRNLPEVMPLPGENVTKKMLRYGSAAWIAHMEILYGKQRKSIRQPDLDDYAALLCERQYLCRRPPDLLTVHLVDCDAMRHWHGVNSAEAHAAMERLDRRVGKIAEAIRKAGLLDETLICVVSDHGQQDAPRGILLDQTLQKACGARAQALGMGAFIFGEDLSAAKNVLEQNKEALGIARIFDETALRQMNAPADVHLAVDACPGCCYIDAPEKTLGEHGFALDCPEARTFFCLSGPGIPKGISLPPMNLVDIAPTLADLMGWELPDAQGRSVKNALRG
ncbi:MAG: alkaline phosphatase family protein [Clostridia bacterium]|nr:alkaline phosphatase family protein [Clostridia bacterium]